MTELLLQVFSLKLLIFSQLLQFAFGSLQVPCNNGEAADPQPPDCLDDCEGRRFFLDRDGLCKMCVQCEPGFQHDKYCGDGENGDAVCVPCPRDHYSYNCYDCVACRVCENTQIDQECSLSADRQCGECLLGFYKDPQNPDLCNQKCEKLSNPQLIPACREWLKHELITTGSPIISLMSSFSVIRDDETRSVSPTLIIVILLVVVLICGSVIPVYVCCKRCRGDPKQGAGNISQDGETCHHQSSQDLELSGASQHQCHESDDSDGTGRIISEAEAMKVVRVGHLPTGQEQIESGGSIENDGEDKDPDKKILNVYSSRENEIDSPNGTSTVLNDTTSGTGNSMIPPYNSYRINSDCKLVQENETSSSNFFPSPNSHCVNSRKLPLEISEDLCVPGTCNNPQARSKEDAAVIDQETSDNRSQQLSLESEVAQRSESGGEEEEENGGKDGSAEGQTLLPGTPLQGTQSIVAGQDENYLQPASGAQRNKVGQEHDERDGNEEELERLLPDVQIKHEEANEGRWRSSADADKPHKRNVKGKGDSSKNGSNGFGMSEMPQTLRSKEGDEKMPSSSGFEKPNRNVDGANGDEDASSTVMENPDKQLRLLTDKQEKDGGGDTLGVDDTEWRGSAEEENLILPKEMGKHAPCEVKSRLLPDKCENKGQQQPQSHCVNHFHVGRVHTLVIGDQTIHYNGAWPQNQGNEIHLIERCENDSDEEEEEEEEEGEGGNEGGEWCQNTP